MSEHGGRVPDEASGGASPPPPPPASGPPPPGGTDPTQVTPGISDPTQVAPTGYGVPPGPPTGSSGVPGGPGEPPVTDGSGRPAWLPVVIILAVLALIGGAVVLLTGGDDDGDDIAAGGDVEVTTTTTEADDTTTTGADEQDEPDGYGDAPRFDALWDACDAGDFAACDDLYRQSPVGSEYEEFGDTCGGRNEPAGRCEDLHGDQDDRGEPDEGDPSLGDYGDDDDLDALWDACEAGGYAACDQLYFDSAFGSRYEWFGDSCGGRNEPAGLCEDIYG